MDNIGEGLNVNPLKKIVFPISPFKQKFKFRNKFNLNNALLEKTDAVKLSEIDDFEKNVPLSDIMRNKSVESNVANDSSLIRNNGLGETYVKRNFLVDSSSGREYKVLDKCVTNFDTAIRKNLTERTFEKHDETIDPNTGEACANDELPTRNSLSFINKSIHHDHMLLDDDTTYSATRNRNMIITNTTESDNVDEGKSNDFNISILGKKKQLVDRLKRSIMEKGKPLFVNDDIVKKEVIEEECADVNYIDKTEDDVQDISIQEPKETSVKMESFSAMDLNDNLSAINTSSIDHFMAMPTVREHIRSKLEMNNNPGLNSAGNDNSLVYNKLICLVCKKTETPVPGKQLHIEGNLFLCNICRKLFEKEGPSNALLSAAKSNILNVTCIRCNLTFSSSEEVEMHNELHKEEDEFGNLILGNSRKYNKPQFCSECNQAFKEPDEVCMHIKKRRHKCIYCHKGFSTNSDLKKHVNIHTNEKTYVCIYCNKSFNSRGNMVKHLETHKERERSFKCEFCGKTFLKSDHLKVHVNTHTNATLYECPYCKKTFNRKYCLQLHINIHTLEKIYECHFCNKVCMDPSTLRKHIATHSDVRPYKCEHCEKTFKQRPHLNAHLKVHNIKETFCCTDCNKMFFSKSSLRVHMNTHTREKMFLCIYCEKTFTSKSNLLTHINNKHTPDKIYNCTHCGKEFTDPSTLKKHTNIHTNELTYQCAYCNKVFLRKTHLRNHIHMHIKYKPYKCKLCNKSFAIKEYLKIHYNLHKGIKPHKCRICRKAFASKGNLIIHINSHTKEHLFQCLYCEKKFTQKTNLKSHINRHHADEQSEPAALI